jgi:hypothetical protein
MIIFIGSTTASAATAKPATAYAVPAATYGIQGHAAMFSLTPAAGTSYPYQIAPGEVKLRTQTVTMGTYRQLHVCLEWADSAVDLSLKVFEPDGSQVSFELADGRVVSAVHDADDGTINGKIDFYVFNDDGTYLQGGNWTYEIVSHSRTEPTSYRI